MKYYIYNIRLTKTSDHDKLFDFDKKTIIK